MDPWTRGDPDKSSSNPSRAEIRLFEPRNQRFFQLEIIINVLISCFCFIRIPILLLWSTTVVIKKARGST